MTLQDFLVKAHDKSINEERLRRYFKEMMYRNFAYEHLDESEKSFVLDIILRHRTKLFAHEPLSASDIEHEYYRIWERRHELKLEENDLKNIKEILHSFKSN